MSSRPQPEQLPARINVNAILRMFGLYSEMGMELRPPVAGPQVIPFPSAETNARDGNIACQ